MAGCERSAREAVGSGAGNRLISPMFDLETAIQTWRRGFRHGRSFFLFTDDVEELESHLREHIAHLIAQGVSPDDAFRMAMHEVGDYGSMESEFRKVYWRKLKHRQSLVRTIFWELIMVKNYLTIALRNLRKRKGYAFINIFGLAVGIAASLLILQYVTHELSYDTFHEDADRIYRVRYDSFRDGERVFKSATSFPKVGPAMQADFPEVEEYVRIFLRYGGEVVRHEDLSFKEDNLLQVDPTFLTMFDYPLLQGDRETALSEPNTAVIEVNTARKYFGDEDPIGKRIRVRTDEEYTITGVIESPENSHLKFTYLLSYSTLVQQWGEGFNNAWGWYDFYNYIRLAPDTDIEALQAKFPDFVVRHSGNEQARERTIFELQALTDIHLYSDLIQEARVNGDGEAVYFLLIIAFFILLIAWVNYVNLSTARAVERAQEIGVRKVMGAEKSQLIRQFILESVWLNVIAAGIAIGLLYASMPLFNQLSGEALSLNLLSDARFWAALIGLFCVGAFLSGLYPAFVLSAYQPVTVLKGKFAQARQGLALRKGLVIGQFVASVGLIAGTMIVYQQLAFMRGQDLGIDIEQTLVVEGPGVITNDSLYSNQFSSFKQQLLQHANVRSVAASTEIPGNLIYWTNGARKLNHNGQQSIIMYKVGIDYDFLDSFGHKLLAGRSYAREFTADDASVILNERALEVLDLGAPPDAVGERVRIGGDTLTVVGVVENFHQEGLQKAYDQIAFILRPNARSYYSVKVNTESVSETLAHISEQYAVFFPENPFKFYFMDAFFDRQYRNEQQFGQVFGFFALLAILVACLGLFGLSSFTAAQRTKEIGIRKVLGSTVPNILFLLSRDYLKLVGIASAIAIPIVWWLIEQWLAGFAFRIGITPLPFIIAAVVTLLIALITVSYQTVKAALANPVDALRYE